MLQEAQEASSGRQFQDRNQVGVDRGHQFQEFGYRGPRLALLIPGQKRLLI